MNFVAAVDPAVIASVFAGIVSVITALSLLVTAARTDRKLTSVHEQTNANLHEVKDELVASRADVAVLKDALGVPASTDPQNLQGQIKP